MNVSLPTPSYTTGTPFFFVINLNALDDVLARADDHLRGTMLTDESRLFVAANDRNHFRSKRRGPLQRDETHSARRGVQKNRLVPPHAVTAPQQEPGGEPFQHQGGGVPIRD